MQKNRLKILFILFITSTLFSCHNETKKNAESPYFTAFFTGNEDAVLRDINFNISADEIKKTELSKLYETTSDHLFYIFSFPTDSTAFSEYANVQYFFNENNQLDIITADIYLNDTIQQDNLENSITDYYNQRYGDAETNANNFPTWSGTFKDISIDKKYPYSITLKDLDDETDDDAIGLTVEYYLQR